MTLGSYLYVGVFHNGTEILCLYDSNQSENCNNTSGTFFISMEESDQLYLNSGEQIYSDSKAPTMFCGKFICQNE